MSRQLLLIIGFVFSFFIAKSQTTEKPWLVGFGWHAPQMSIGDQFFFREWINVKNWNATPAAAQLKASRHLKAGLSLATSISFGTASRVYSSLNKRNFFLDADLTLKYSFANGYLLKEKCWFDPYLFVGGGLNYWNNIKGNVEGGFGINFWFVPQFGIYVQESYNYLPGKTVKPVDINMRPSYLHHAIGVVARFGNKKDTDKDGIPDVVDQCPDIPGQKEMNGCPDTDGDGIIDMNDKCPLQKGTAATAGCPDTDGDGVIDIEDNCPTEKGTIQLKGCPDTDGDGIADNIDDCPNIKGIALFKGCPDTDNDGVMDKNDKCPEIPGTIENKGCPEVKLQQEEKKLLQEKLNFSAKNIEFETGSDIIRNASFDDLDNVVDILHQFNTITLHINGHTDNVGNIDKNLDLSLKRAVAVQAYLRNKGIDFQRLIVAGYGQMQPIADNNTAAGRQKNRRVELLIAP